MAALTEDTLAETFEEILDVFSDPDEWRTKWHPSLSLLQDTIRWEVLDYCLWRFVGAETDYETAGDRGIGRLTPEIPRFGAYFRRPLTRLAVPDLARGRDLLTRVIFAGYVSRSLSPEVFRSATHHRDREALFEDWVMRIYAARISQHDIATTLALTDVSMTRLRRWMLKHGLKGGGLFSRDRTDDILHYLPLAGYVLRHIEEE